MSNKITIQATPEVEALIAELKTASEQIKKSEATADKAKKLIRLQVPFVDSSGMAVDSWTFNGTAGSATVMITDSAVAEKRLSVLNHAGLTHGIDYWTTTKIKADTQALTSVALADYVRELQELNNKHRIRSEVAFEYKLAERQKLKDKLGEGFVGFMADLGQTVRITIK